MTPMTNQSKRSISKVVKASASILSNCGYSPACLGHSLALTVMHEKPLRQLITAVHHRYRCGAYAHVADGHRPFMLHIYAALAEKERALTAIKAAASLRWRTRGDAETAQRSGSSGCGDDAAHAARSRPIWQRRICSRQYGAPRCATGAAQ